jgi:hypothetical protein
MSLLSSLPAPKRSLAPSRWEQDDGERNLALVQPSSAPERAVLGKVLSELVSYIFLAIFSGNGDQKLTYHDMCLHTPRRVGMHRFSRKAHLCVLFCAAYSYFVMIISIYQVLRTADQPSLDGGCLSLPCRAHAYRRRLYLQYSLFMSSMCAVERSSIENVRWVAHKTQPVTCALP